MQPVMFKRFWTFSVAVECSFVVLSIESISFCATTYSYNSDTMLISHFNVL